MLPRGFFEGRNTENDCLMANQYFYKNFPFEVTIE